MFWGDINNKNIIYLYFNWFTSYIMARDFLGDYLFIKLNINMAPQLENTIGG